MYSTTPINNSGGEHINKKRWCCTHLILIGIAGLVGLGFVIAILTIVNLNKISLVIENYLLLTSKFNDVILLLDKILNDAIKELPNINDSISKLTSILTWICKQNPDINC